MGLFTRGDIIVAPLDFSDFSNYKRRPALVVATPSGLDPVLCLITSRGRDDGYDVSIGKTDFASGGLRIDSFVRTCHLFTIDENIIEYKAGQIKDKKLAEVVTKIVTMLQA